MGEQTATLDHILVFPPDLRVIGGGASFLEDTLYVHAVRWATVNGNDAGFPFAPDPTKTPFCPQIQKRNWAKAKPLVTAAVLAEAPLEGHLPGLAALLEGDREGEPRLPYADDLHEEVHAA